MKSNRVKKGPYSPPRNARGRPGPSTPRLRGRAREAVVRELFIASRTSKIGPHERKRIVRDVEKRLARAGYVFANRSVPEAIRELMLALTARARKRQARKVAKDARLPMSALDEAMIAHGQKKFGGRFGSAPKTEKMTAAEAAAQMPTGDDEGKVFDADRVPSGDAPATPPAHPAR